MEWPNTYSLIRAAHLHASLLSVCCNQIDLTVNKTYQLDEKFSSGDISVSIFRCAIKTIICFIGPPIDTIFSHNIKCFNEFQGKVSISAYEAWKSIAEQLNNYLIRRSNYIGLISFTGHGSGGALALMQSCMNVVGKIHIDYSWTFGCPTFCDNNWLKYYEHKKLHNHRIINKRDIFALKNMWSREHIGTPSYITDTDALNVIPISSLLFPWSYDDHKLTSYITSLEKILC